MDQSSVLEMFDVIVVGYGPTGLTLASLLGGQGHQVAVVERWPTLYGKPRLTHIDGETARLISQVADADHALRDSWTTPHYYWVNGKQQLLMDVAAGNTRKMLWDDHISVHQPHIEDAIHERIAAMPNVQLFRGYRANQLRQENGVVLLSAERWRREGEDEAETNSGAETIHLKGRYLVGCDGAKSFVRESLGIERQDFGFNERWLCVDTERLRALPSKFNENAMQVCDPRRGYMFMPIGRQRQRFEFALLPNESSEDMSREAAAWALLKSYHGLGPDDLKLIRHLVYVFECRLARQWRQGNVFLAGDAAHTNPPYLGQGACSGMRDAANLAWKLDLVLRGLAEDALLDTYYEERMPHARKLMLDSRALGLIANTSNPIKAFIRDRIFRWKLAPVPKWPTFESGVLARDASGKLLPQVGSVPGQGRVALNGEPVRFDDVAGFHFVWLSRADVWPDLPADLRERLSDLRVKSLCLSSVGRGSISQSIRDVDGVYGRLLDTLQADGVLLRPDFVLYGYAPKAGAGAFLQEFATQVSAPKIQR